MNKTLGARITSMFVCGEVRKSWVTPGISTLLHILSRARFTMGKLAEHL